MFIEDAHKVSSTCAYCIPRYSLASTLLLLCTHNNESQNVGGTGNSRGSPTKRDPLSCITVTGSVRDFLQHFPSIGSVREDRKKGIKIIVKNVEKKFSSCCCDRLLRGPCYVRSIVGPISSN